MWFEDLMGFSEENPRQVRENCFVENEILKSRFNGREFRIGEFETLTLGELRERTGGLKPSGKIRVSEVVGNVRSIHQTSENRNALFQVASQFNLLEMVSPGVTPEQGVGIYEYDGTQGPACAIACGAGTIYRNYFLPVGEQVGQTADRQIDCLADLGEALGNRDGNLWKMRNGYALPGESGLRQIEKILLAAPEPDLDRLRTKLRIGIHWNTAVTLNGSDHEVAQVYGSALPVAYSGISSNLWERFGCLVLEASYEATLLASLINASRTGSRKVYLTLLGGGAFGNPAEWILSAIRRAIQIIDQHNLDIRIVSYGSSNPEVSKLTEEFH